MIPNDPPPPPPPPPPRPLPPSYLYYDTCLICWKAVYGPFSISTWLTRWWHRRKYGHPPLTRSTLR